MVADQDKTNLPANTDSATRSATSILDAFTKGTALLVGLIYLCGFLALNSYLYKYGIVSLGIGNTDYVVAGSIFVLFLTIYALFGGRAIVLMKEWMSGHIKMIVEAGGPSSGPRSAFAHSFIELTFFTCLSAAFFTSIAIDGFESFWFYAVLGVGFLIIYPLDGSDYDRKHPYAFLHIDGAIKLLAIVSFFILPPAEKRIHVFLTFMGFSTYINIVLDTFERYRINTDRIMFTIVYSVIFFLGSAVTFGAFFYGDVSRKIGGGKPIEMEMGIEPTSLTDLPQSSHGILEGKFIFASNDSVFLNVKDKTLVIPRNNIRWMQFSSPSNLEFLKVFGVDPKSFAPESNSQKHESGTKRGSRDGT